MTNESNSETALPGRRLKETWLRGEATLNGWLAAPDPTVAEAMAVLGWESLTIDMQHGMADYAAALRMLIALSTTPVVPMARVPWLDEAAIMRTLDAGAYGIICPMVNDRDSAVRFARACRYAPRGNRSFGPIRARLHATGDYAALADDAILAIAMIETRQAVEQLEAILSVEELDAVYIGPADLSLSFGAAPSFAPTAEPVLQAIEHIVATAKSFGKFVGIHNGTSADALRRVRMGADFVTVASDLRLMTSAAQAAIAEFRGGVAGDA